MKLETFLTIAAIMAIAFGLGMLGLLVAIHGLRIGAVNALALCGRIHVPGAGLRVLRVRSSALRGAS